MTKNRNRESIDLEIESIGFEGISIARNDGMVYFVKNAVPGDIVEAEIIRKKRNYVEAKVKEIIIPSESRVEAPCQYFGVCGGCKWQNLDYSEQLRWKRQFVLDSFKRIGGLNVPEIRETLPSPQIYNYRNKMEFSFGASRWLTDEEILSGEDIQNRYFGLGLHIPDKFDKVLDIEKCLIQSELGNIILKIIRKNLSKLGLSAYHQRKHTGFLRNLIIRTNKNSSDLMVILITSSLNEANEYEFMKWYKSELNYIIISESKRHNEIESQILTEVDNISLIHAVNDTVNPVATGRIDATDGKGYITENILDIKYRISPFSFFQTNSEQLGRLVGTVLALAEIQNTDVVWDLYCGTGSFTLSAAKMGKYAYGFEISQDTVADAKLNAELNGIENVEFNAVDLHLKEIPLPPFSKRETGLPDIIIIDPPRAGIHKNLIEYILQFDALRIVYVSCNPATQARDCALLAGKYEVKYIQPVDMFPHTYHIESVAVLERVNSE